MSPVRTVILADGRPVTYREAGSGRPLILLHGWSMSSAVFDEVMALLAHRCRLLAPDLRGHGGSSCAPADSLGLPDLVADLIEWLDALDLTELTVLGWSLGGQVSMELCRSLAGRINKLILVSTTPRFCAGDGWPHGLPETQLQALARDLRRRYLKTMEDFFKLQFAGEALEQKRFRQILDFAVRPGRLPLPEIALAALETLRSSDLRPVLPRIDCPALVLHGGLDRIIPPAAGQYLGETLPQARFELLSDAGHAPFLSRRDETLAFIEEFLG